VPVFRFGEGEDPDAVIDDLIRSKQRIQAIKAVRELYGISLVEAHHRVLARYEQIHGHGPDAPEG
jgi:ribosomal protein L7/L12